MTTYDLSGTNYSESDSANSNAAPAGMPEGMAPSGVNDAWRSGMGAVKRAYDWDHAGTWATIGGTANAITLTYSVAPNAYVQGQKHAFKATASNTGATTVNINSLGAQNIFKKTAAGVAACTGGEIENGDIVEIEYDGTQFQIVGQTANSGFAETSGTIASASTVSIGAAAANYLQVTGTTTITAFDTIAAGTRRFLEFAGALTLTHNATSLILPGGASITTAAGDVAIMISEGLGNWRCANYMKASGIPLIQFGTVIAQDRKSSGTQGASLTQNTYADRDLNTLILNTVGGATAISTPNLTLPAGTYDVTAALSTINNTGIAAVFRSRLFNTTGSAVLTDVNGNDIVSVNAAQGGSITQLTSAIRARFTISGTTALKFQSYCSGTGGLAGLASNGTGNSEPEVYLSAEFVKVA